MTDIVDSATRSRMMSGIRSVNTKPELLVRKLLHARGFRYRLHYRKLPGRPDMVLKKYNAVIFIHGCFWHGHDCHLFKWPSTRPDFWKQKIESNRKRDKTVFVNLTHLGFRICIVWECALNRLLKKERVEVYYKNNNTIWWVLCEDRKSSRMMCFHT